MNTKELEKRCNELFFQVNEKTERIAELEKENAELKKKCYKKAVKDYCELEKENAELKETLKTYNGCGDWDNDFHTCRVYLQHEELQKCMEQLVKAKDHIKKLLDCLQQDTNDPQTNYYVVKYMTEAEQFLNSEVEK